MPSLRSAKERRILITPPIQSMSSHIRAATTPFSQPPYIASAMIAIRFIKEFQYSLGAGSWMACQSARPSSMDGIDVRGVGVGGTLQGFRFLGEMAR
jgi:hypothetical protein